MTILWDIYEKSAKLTEKIYSWINKIYNDFQVNNFLEGGGVICTQFQIIFIQLSFLKNL